MGNSFLIIDFCEAPSIKKLNMRYLEGGEPDVFDFHCLEQLEELDISENSVAKLILKNGLFLNKLSAYDIGNSGMQIILLLPKSVSMMSIKKKDKFHN